MAESIISVRCFHCGKILFKATAHKDYPVKIEHVSRSEFPEGKAVYECHECEARCPESTT